MQAVPTRPTVGKVDRFQTRCAAKEWILVVEDRPDLLDVIRGLLELQGYNVLLARGAGEALAILQINKAVSVLFTDVIMPDMNGVQLAQAALKLAPTLHVVLASGYPAEAMAAAIEADCNFPLLLKPYSARELRAALSR